MTRQLRFYACVLSLLFAFATLSHAQIIECPSGVPKQEIRLNQLGTPARLGEAKEAPVCVEAIFNTFRFDASLIGTTSTKGGPDPSSVITSGGGAAKGIVKLAPVIPTTVDGRIKQINQTIADIQAFLAFTDKEVLIHDPKTITAHLLAEAAQKSAVGESLQKELAGSLAIIEPGAPAPSSPPTADQQKTLDRITPIINIWIRRLSERGIMPEGDSHTPAQSSEILYNSLVQVSEVKCGNIFNSSSSTVFALTVIDETPTLSDATSTPKPNSISNIYTATCSSPVSVSAGVEFSGIRNQEFAIIKVPNANGTASVSKYGLVTDNAIHPLPIGIANFRIADFDQAKRWAIHASFGVSGNIQGQGSGGSSVEFLPGVSFSFIRTIFLTVGPHIGQKSELAGGLKVGDPVLPDASTPPTVTKSYIVRWGVAITFTKP